MRKLVRDGRGWPVYVLAVFFAVFTMIGRTFQMKGDLSLFAGSPQAWLRGAVVFIVLAGLYAFLLSLLYGRLTAVTESSHVASGTAAQDGMVLPDGTVSSDIAAGKDEKHHRAVDAVLRFFRRTQNLSDRRYFLLAFAFLMLCWLPYLIIYYPGSTVPDGLWQIQEGLGMKTLSGKHSWELSLLFGFLVKLGSHVNDNAGFFLVVLFLAVSQALCYAWVCRKIRQWKAPDWLTFGTPLFFGLYPLFGAYAQTLIKDGISCALFTLFMTAYLDLCLPDVRMSRGDSDDSLKVKTGEKRWGKAFAVLLCALAAALTRRNEMYILLPMTLFLFILLRKGSRRYALLIFAGLLAGYLGFAGLGRAIGVKDGSSRAYYSVMFQQTARYLTEYPDEVTKEEKQAINGVLKLKKITGKYNPDLSDPVKNRFREKSTAEDLQAYFGVWKGMLKKHPLVYVEAFLHGNYGYYDPFSLITVTSPYYLDASEAYSKTLGYDWHHIFPALIRKAARGYAWLWKKLPVLRLTIRPGSWTWFYFILAGWLCLKKRWKKLLPLIGMGLLWGICLLSPVNGCIRYYLPMYACGPVLLWWSFWE